MNVRAHKRLWTLCIANEPESRKAMKFIIGAIKHRAIDVSMQLPDFLDQGPDR